MNPIIDYIDELGLYGRSYSTIKQNKQALKSFQNSSNGKDILQVDEDDVKTFIRDMRTKKSSDRTIKEYISTLEKFYSYVIECQKYGLTVNPFKRINKQLNFRKKQTKRPIKTIDEISTFIRNVHNARDRAIIVLLAKTAIRNGEAIALDVNDIDFNKETININKRVENHSTNSIEKGRKNRNETLIPMDDELIRALKFYLATRQKTNDTALFISNTGKRLYPTDISRIVKEWSIKTGIGNNSNDTDKKIVPHFFRAWATYTLQINGLNPSIIDFIRGDVANTTRGFYFNQVLPFEVIKKEYLKAVPKFGI